MKRHSVRDPLVSWARLSPRTSQSAPGTAAAAPARATPTSRDPRRGRHRGRGDRHLPGGARPAHRQAPRHAKALVAVTRSILVIVWHLLADPTARYHDLGADYYASRIDTGRKTRNHVRQLEALGYKVTLQPAA